MPWLVQDPATGKSVRWRPPTEDLVARRLAETQAGRLRYCHDARAWFAYDGALWRRDRTGVAARLVRDIARELGTEPDGRRVMGVGRPGFVEGALRFAREEAPLAVTADDWDADPWLLGTPEGPVDLRTGAFAPRDAADGISRATAVAPAPPGAAAPAWTRFLRQILGGDVALVDFVQRFLGYALTGSNTERVVVLGYGTGAGKTTLLSTVLHVMGDYARSLELATLTRPEAAAALRGTRLVALAGAEPDLGGRRLARLAGGDPIGASDARGMVPTFKLLAMAETPPSISRADAALGRRLCYVRFYHRPVRPDPRLAETLRDEAPAILRWMIDGALAWQSRGLDPPSGIVDATGKSLEPRGPLDRFLAERCERDGARTATAGDLWRAWQIFAEATGAPTGSQRLFATALGARGFARDRTETARFYRGVGLRKGLTHDAADAWNDPSVKKHPRKLWWPFKR